MNADQNKTLCHLDTNTLHFLAESNVSSSRNALKDDLVNKIIYDEPGVLARLRVDEVDNYFVASCVASFEAANQDDMKLLTALAEQASKKKNDDLEREEIDDRASDPNKEEKSGNHGSAEEKKMYDPLVRLFSYIVNFSGGVAPRRKFQRTSGMLKAEEPHTFGFPSCSPDLTISSIGADASKSKIWRDRDAFGEVKPSKKQGPKPATEGTIPAIVTQSSNYARLFMSSRPFMLFCVGILIFGTNFCVGIFDRDGITFSPIGDMFKDIETFIRVIRSLACNMSIEELGSDPTVRVLSDSDTQKLTGEGHGAYPSAVVSSVGGDHRRWCTIGYPIWTSMSFLGRGTNVWRVREYIEDGQPSLGGEVLIMKTAWRSSARNPESDIYMSIQNPPEGLAEFECGGDVMFLGYPITVQNLRCHPLHNSTPEGDPATPVLHRLFLRTVGSPMWEYTSEIDLLIGFRDAIQAHKNLCDQGILHRDISAGNVLMVANRNGPLRGFITDLEFARIKSSTLTKPQVTVIRAVEPENKYHDRGHVLSRTEATTRTHTTFESTVAVKRGAGITGTVQFMAREILMHANQNPAINVVHQEKHDIESFIWVLSYCVMRNIYHRAFKSSVPKEVKDQRGDFRHLFQLMFGQTTTFDIARSRQSGSGGLIFPKTYSIAAIITNFMSNALVALFSDIEFLIHGVNDPRFPTTLTHETLLEAVNNAITSLSSSGPQVSTHV